MTPYDFAKIAAEAYTAPPDIGAADSASRAIVRHTAAGLVVAFPGTDNLACVTTDLDIETVDVVGVGPVHAGFWRAYKAISVDVLAAIDGKPVTLVGHSLGAALALCCAVEMTVGGNPPLAAYAFEPPRLSPTMCVRTLLAKVPVFATRNGLDLVTQVPLEWQQSSLLKHIGHAALPIANVEDHAIARVIAALAMASSASPDGGQLSMA